MGNNHSDLDATSVDLLIAQRLKSLRVERGWSLDELARRSNVSRATLSRLENAEVSPTTNVLGKLCTAYGLTMSRLMHMVEDNFIPLVPQSAQEVWMDQSVGFRRRSLSPPAHSLAAEVLECELEAGMCISYEQPPTLGLEHHLLLREGQLEIRVNDQTYELKPGDCLRYQLSGSSIFRTSEQYSARYILVIVSAS